MHCLGLFFKGKFKKFVFDLQEMNEIGFTISFQKLNQFFELQCRIIPLCTSEIYIFCLIILFSSKEWNVLPRIRRSSLLLSFLCFYVGFVPLEYVQSIPPLSTFVIAIHTCREGNHVKKSFVF